MHLVERRLDGVTVLDVFGRLTGDHPGHLKDRVSKVLLRGEKRIVLNLLAMSYVDSTGLGELISCYTRATKYDAQIALANADERTQYLFEVTKLLSIFDSFDSEQAAIASFGLLAA